MQKICAVFDIGKTNKKLLALDENYNLVFEKQIVFQEVLDDDGIVCEDLLTLTNWIKSEFELLKNNENFKVVALNFSGYGASFVHLGADYKPVAPLYNYLKILPKAIKQDFLEKYNQDGFLFLRTASPDLNLLNSGLQLFWLKKHKVEIYKHIKYSLHLPQYLSYVFSNITQAELTSIGCHTALWDFPSNSYHNWLANENMHSVTLNIANTHSIIEINDLKIGAGIHDSSAALVPYLKTVKEPFVLISTGTWCISLNPFNKKLLTQNELNNDCLNYISFEGEIVRASRLFAGSEHERQKKHLSNYFKVSIDFYKTVEFDFKIIQSLRKNHKQVLPQQTDLGQLRDCPFVERNLNAFKTFEIAYHQFIMDLVAQQIASTKLTFGNNSPQKIFVDGGFSKNDIFMNLLSEAFINIEVYASEISQASSIGAAMVISDHWTDKDLDESALKLKRFF
jgi:L-fuculokinase